MLRLLKNKRAQNTIEYALIIAVVIGAFTAMQLYNRRAISMRVKKGMDLIPFKILGSEQANGTSYLIPAGDNPETFIGKATDIQYEPYYYAKGDYDMNTTSTEGKEVNTVDGVQKLGSRTLGGQTTQRLGKQEITGWKKEDEGGAASIPSGPTR